MIWGCLWDRTLIWLSETNQVSSGINGKSYAEIVDSSSWGNYSSVFVDASRESTGSNEVWKANNIYDMAGNMSEWTMKAGSNRYRTIRGGSYEFASSHNVSERFTQLNSYYAYPTYSYSIFGSRSILYIEP